MIINGQGSFWIKSKGLNGRGDLAGLDSDISCDLAIIGAGLSGLWTAYWAKRQFPEWDVVVIEEKYPGFGASARNGGWISDKLVGLPHVMQNSRWGLSGVASLQKLLRSAVEEIVDVCELAQTSRSSGRVGRLELARSPAEDARLRAQFKSQSESGLLGDDVRLLDAAEVRERVNISKVVSAVFSPHTAVVDPAEYVENLWSVVENLGVKVYGGTKAIEVRDRVVETTRGTVKAPKIIVATEGYTTGKLRNLGKLTQMPIMSSMIVTRPLTAPERVSLDWSGREAIGTVSHRAFYSQYTPDGRIALGGRGLPYRYGGTPDYDGQVAGWSVRELRRILSEAFPTCAAVEIEHAWCGSFGLPRDWSPSVDFDATTGVGVIGGYAGQGLTASYLAAKTIVDLLSNVSSEYTQLPWTGRRPQRWEPEPLRFIGAYAIYGLYQAADRIEQRTGQVKTSRLARLADVISGRSPVFRNK